MSSKVIQSLGNETPGFSTRRPTNGVAEWALKRALEELGDKDVAHVVVRLKIDGDNINVSTIGTEGAQEDLQGVSWQIAKLVRYYCQEMAKEQEAQN